jgi:hypothetical protein
MPVDLSRVRGMGCEKVGGQDGEWRRGLLPMLGVYAGYRLLAVREAGIVELNWSHFLLPHEETLVGTVILEGKVFGELSTRERMKLSSQAPRTRVVAELALGVEDGSGSRDLQGLNWNGGECTGYADSGNRYEHWGDEAVLWQSQGLIVVAGKFGTNRSR